MFALLYSLTIFVIDFFKSRRRLEAENLFLRHQLSIALRRASLRLRLRGSDRALLAWMTRRVLRGAAKGHARMRTLCPESGQVDRHLAKSALCQSRHWETMAYFAALAALSINAATSRACERKIAWLPGSSMTCDWARFAMNRSRSGLIIRSCLEITA